MTIIYRNHRNHYLLGLVLCASIVLGPVASESTESPVEWFKHDLLQALKLRHHTGSIRSTDAELQKHAIWTIVDKAFDGDEINPRILEQTWPVLTDEEKNRLRPVMNYVIKWKLIGKLFKYDVEKVSFTRERLDSGFYVLEGSLGSGWFRHPVTFVFVEKNGQWAACDLKVRGFSLIDHYRRKFDGTYFKNGLDGLIRHLIREVNEEFEEMGYAPTGVPSLRPDNGLEPVDPG
jgi:ABC-type transporter MlaC component